MIARLDEMQLTLSRRHSATVAASKIDEVITQQIYFNKEGLPHTMALKYTMQAHMRTLPYRIFLSGSQFWNMCFAKVAKLYDKYGSTEYGHAQLLVLPLLLPGLY